MRLLFKAMTCCAMATTVLISCQKEENVLPEQIVKEGIVTVGDLDTPAVINGKTYVYKHTGNKAMLKGVYANHLTGAPWLRVTAGEAKVDGSSKTYVTMKVVKSDTPGDYYYIMCENLDIPGSNSNNYLSYDFSTENEEKYGLLYDWNEANNLRSKVYMELPMVYQGVEYADYTSRCFGELPSREDIEALLGSSVGHLPSNGTSPSAMANKKYYDAFVGGLGAENEAYDLTLVGYANNMDYPPQRFFGMQKHTKLWTSELTPAENAAYPLSITREQNDGTIFNYVAYINAGHAQRYAMVVRYVFRPSVE